MGKAALTTGIRGFIIAAILAAVFQTGFDRLAAWIWPTATVQLPAVASDRASETPSGAASSPNPLEDVNKTAIVPEQPTSAGEQSSSSHRPSGARYLPVSYTDEAANRWLDVAISVSVNQTPAPPNEYEREVAVLRSGLVSFTLEPNVPSHYSTPAVTIRGATVTHIVTRRIPATDTDRFELMVNGSVQVARSIRPEDLGTIEVRASVDRTDTVLLALYSPNGTQRVVPLQ